MSRDERPMTLGDFVAQMQEYFEVKGRNQVRGRRAGGGDEVRGRVAGHPGHPQGADRVDIHRPAQR